MNNKNKYLTKISMEKKFYRFIKLSTMWRQLIYGIHQCFLICFRNVDNLKVNIPLTLWEIPLISSLAELSVYILGPTWHNKWHKVDDPLFCHSTKTNKKKNPKKTQNKQTSVSVQMETFLERLFLNSMPLWMKPYISQEFLCLLTLRSLFYLLQVRHWNTQKCIT